MNLLLQLDTLSQLELSVLYTQIRFQGYDLSSIPKISPSEVLETNFMGVYLLWNANELVYIGKTTNIIHRLHSHRCKESKHPGKVFNKVQLIYCKMEIADLLEIVLITRFKPKLNVSGRNDLHERVIKRRIKFEWEETTHMEPTLPIQSDPPKSISKTSIKLSKKDKKVLRKMIELGSPFTEC